MVNQKTNQKFELETEGSKELQTLRESRQNLSDDIYNQSDKFEESFSKLENIAEGTEELSKIDTTLQDYGTYKQTIADLTAGLSSQLTEFVQFSQKSKNYQGAEKVWRYVHKAKADRMRVLRLQKQSPRENLQSILDYGTQLHNEICEVRLDAIKTFERLQANVDVITKKVGEYQPQEAALKEKLDAIDAEYKKIETQYEEAEPGEQAKLTKQKNEIHKQLTEVRHKYDQMLTKYNQAQQAIAPAEKTRDGFEQMMRDLGRQATMVKEKIDNVTEIYCAAPEAVKIMMTTKGMERFDKTINVATDESVKMVVESTEAVRDTTQRREAIQLIDEKEMRKYIENINTTLNTFNENMENIRTQAQRSQKERYSSK